MKSRIEAKIELIIEQIIRKPQEEITIDDFAILEYELSSIRLRESQEYSRKKFEEAFYKMDMLKK